jgi:predicted nucleic acid-binding protein
VRIVVDTSVLFAGLYSRRGASHAVLRGCLSGRWTPLVTVPLALQYEDVMSRPELVTGSGLTRAELEAFLDGFLAVCDPIGVHFLWRPNLPDEEDNLVLEAAVAGNADAIVTHNVRDFRRGQLRFDVPILTPAELLNMEDQP